MSTCVLSLKSLDSEVLDCESASVCFQQVDGAKLDTLISILRQKVKIKVEKIFRTRASPPFSQM